MRHNRPAELRTRGLPTLHPLARRATRLPPGHPEEFPEGSATLYADFADPIAARRMGVPPDPLAAQGPDGTAGVDGVAFIDACLESSSTKGWATFRVVDRM